MSLNIWHYSVFAVLLILFIFGIVRALQEPKPKMRYSMIFTITLITVFMALFSVFVVDKYTKHVKLYKLKNRRLLSIERISYTGVVKNVGNYPIAKVTLEIKLVNRGNASGNIKAGSFYKASGFFGFFSNGFGISNEKPQTLVKNFVVAKNLKAGQAHRFYIHFRYPPYFQHVAQFTKVTGR